MNTDNYNMAIDRLVFYMRMAVLAAGTETPGYDSYVSKLSAGSSILAIASGKGLGEVERDVRDAYGSMYRR